MSFNEEEDLFNDPRQMCEICEGFGSIQKTYNKGQQLVDEKCQECDGLGYIEKW